MLKSLVGQEAKVFEYMDRKENLSLWNYIFLRKVNSALINCGDQSYFTPAKLYCGLAITSPRSPVISSPEEKEVYLAAIILT